MLATRISTLIALAIVPAGIWFSLEAGRPHPDQTRRAESPRQRAADLVFEQEFSVGPGGALVVDLPDGDVEVRTGSGSTVRVEAFVSARDRQWGREVFDRMRFRADLSGTTVRVDGEDPRIERHEWRDGRGVSVRAVITVPSKFDVDVGTSDGDIGLEQIDGRVELRSSDGDIEVNAVTGGELRVQTSDGDILADRLDIERTWLRTSDGDIRVRNFSGALEANTSDGDIEVYLASHRGVALSTNDGDITIHALEDLGADIVLEGEDLSVPRGFSLRGQVTRRRIEGTMNGGGPRIEARTHDGEIRLKTTP
jgi:DUF4097 and DUF4098 domain-containing protein YvlB